MDDFEDPRVQRLRVKTYQQVRKCITSSVLLLPKDVLDRLQAEAQEKTLDIYKVVAAHVLKVPIEAVTAADCTDVKNAFVGMTTRSPQ